MNPREIHASEVREFQNIFGSLKKEISRVVIGLDEIIEQTLISFFAGGHVLIEGVPGTGKTLLVRTLAQCLNLDFKRVQFTVDLMPSDITGTRTLTDRALSGVPEFVRGPLFTHLLLADEINRATPKTQSALLEAMAEHQVTVSGITYPLDSPFFVLATLNPIEMEGTFPLPEAQLDRFLFKVVLPYPGPRELQQILSETTGVPRPGPAPIFTSEEAPARIESMKRLVREVLTAPHVEEYAARLLGATMPASNRGRTSTQDPVTRYVSYGSSPRGGQALLLGGRVRALLDGRVNVSLDDLQRVAIPALSHRLVLNFAAQADEIDPRELVEKIVLSTRRSSL